MNIRIYTIPLFCLILLVLGCEKDLPVVPTEEEGEEMIDIDPPMGTENYLSLDSDYIFDQDELHTFELNLSEADLERLDSDPVAEEFVEGSLTFDGETISPIGIRYKGSIGAFVGCLSGVNPFEPSGRKTCTKLSIKLKFNWLDSDDTFYGLKKLQFHSMNNDPSQMRERLGYWLFAEMGVPTPRAVHARLIINGEFVGLFALVEQIDGRFTRHNFDDGKGNLYKEVWPLQFNGNATATSQYLGALETNEDEDPNVSIIENFGKALVNSSIEDRRDLVNQTMDLDNIMSYIAVDRTIRHDDGPFHWYCGGGDCTNHNYFWYEEPENRKLHLIPWDLDHAFGNIIVPENEVVDIKDDWGETSNNCEPFFATFFIQQWSAACDPLTETWVSFDEEYQSKIDAFKMRAFSANSIQTQLDKWSSQIEAATIEASQDHDDAITLGQWQNAMNSLRNQVDFARNN